MSCCRVSGIWLYSRQRSFISFLGMLMARFSMFFS